MFTNAVGGHEGLCTLTRTQTHIHLEIVWAGRIRKSNNHWHLNIRHCINQDPIKKKMAHLN